MTQAAAVECGDETDAFLPHAAAAGRDGAGAADRSRDARLLYHERDAEGRALALRAAVEDLAAASLTALLHAMKRVAVVLTWTLLAVVTLPLVSCVVKQPPPEERGAPPMPPLPPPRPLPW